MSETPRKKDKKAKKSKKEKTDAAELPTADNTTDAMDSDAKLDNRETEDRRGSGNADTPAFGKDDEDNFDDSAEYTQKQHYQAMPPSPDSPKGKGKGSGKGRSLVQSQESFRASSPDSGKWGNSESYDDSYGHDPNIYSGQGESVRFGYEQSPQRVRASGGNDTQLPSVENSPSGRSKKNGMPSGVYKKAKFDRSQSNAILANKISAAQGGGTASARHRNLHMAKSPRAQSYLRKKSPQKPELAKWITNPAKLSLHDFLQAQIKLTKSWLVYNEAEMKVTEEKICRTILKGISSQLPHVDNPPAGMTSKKVNVTSPNIAAFHNTPRGPKPNAFTEDERMTILLKPVKRCDPKIWARIQKALHESFTYYARADVTLDPMLMDDAIFWATRKQWEMFCLGFDLEVVTGISMSDLQNFYGPTREPIDFAYFLELIGEVAVKTLEWWLEKPIDTINTYAEADGQVALGRLAEIVGWHDEHKSFRQYLRGRANIRPLGKGQLRMANAAPPNEYQSPTGGSAKKNMGKQLGRRGSDYMAGAFVSEEGDANMQSHGVDTHLAEGELAAGESRHHVDPRTRQLVPGEPSAMQRPVDDMEKDGHQWE